MLELVRALGAERGQRVDKGVNGRVGTTPSSLVRQGHSLKVLRTRLADLVAAADPADLEAVARIRRPLLQAIILWEFGSDFRQNPEFGPMLDTLERTFEADPRMPGRLVDLIRDLQR